ncbi:MAG: DNA double-strand break repair nuclease NurA [Candidatus Bathyarchaeia archaeon]
MGLKSLEAVSLEVAQLYESSDGQYEDGLFLGNLRSRPEQLIRLNQGKKVPVVAVDTTNIDLGLTGRGLLCAFRGTVVKADGGKCSFTRYGPYFFHVTPSNRQSLYNGLKQAYLGYRGNGSAPPVEKMSDVIRTILERWLQHQAALSCSGALLLWDGSLATPATGWSTRLVTRILKEAEERGNRVLAISKTTSFEFRDGGFYSLIPGDYAPSLLSLDNEAKLSYGSRLCLLGYVYAAKLSRLGPTLRLDVDRGLSEEEAMDSVQQLLASDLIRDNYPETLRLAHMISRFSQAETVGMQRLLCQRYGVHLFQAPDLRSIVLGPLEGSRYNLNLGDSPP